MISTRSQLFTALCMLVLAVVNSQGRTQARSANSDGEFRFISLTFSPDWGKRSVGGSGSVGSGAAGFFDTQPSGNCKTSNEMLLEIFRFVQAEAQLFLDCKHRE